MQPFDCLYDRQPIGCASTTDRFGRPPGRHHQAFPPPPLRRLRLATTRSSSSPVHAREQRERALLGVIDPLGGEEAADRLSPRVLPWNQDFAEFGVPHALDVQCSRRGTGACPRLRAARRRGRALDELDAGAATAARGHYTGDRRTPDGSRLAPVPRPSRSGLPRLDRAPRPHGPPLDLPTDFEVTWWHGAEFGHIAFTDGRAEWPAVLDSPAVVRYDVRSRRAGGASPAGTSPSRRCSARRALKPSSTTTSTN